MPKVLATDYQVPGMPDPLNAVRGVGAKNIITAVVLQRPQPPADVRPRPVLSGLDPEHLGLLSGCP
jgi:hypothetical protein